MKRLYTPPPIAVYAMTISVVLSMLIIAFDNSFGVTTKGHPLAVAIHDTLLLASGAILSYIVLLWHIFTPSREDTKTNVKS